MSPTSVTNTFANKIPESGYQADHTQLDWNCEFVPVLRTVSSTQESKLKFVIFSIILLDINDLCFAEFNEDKLGAF